MIPLIADLCAAPPDVAPTPDVDDSAAYGRVGDDARAAGDIRIAAIAYRRAIAADPSNTHAATWLAELCRADRATTPGDAALADALARYHRGDLEGARGAFAAIIAAGAASLPAAHFFLGLIALHDHEGTTATDHFELAGRDPAYSGLAGPLLRLARRDGPITALVVVAPELDTDPQLVPDTPPPGATTGPRQTDEDLLVVGTLTARPRRWIVLRDVLAWRKQRALTTLDFLGETAEAAVEYRGAAIRYDFDYDALDGVSYLIASRGTAAYRRELGDFAVAASYSLRRRDYQQPAQYAFTGYVHAAEAGGSVHVAPRLDVELRAIGWRELTADASFSDVAGGVRATVRGRPTNRVRTTVGASAWYASYDAPEPDGSLRRDVHVEGGADVEVDLGDHVMAVGGVSYAHNDSTIADFVYWKLVARVGFAIAVGGP